MKATLVKFPYTVNTGDECKGYRPATQEGRAILFEDGERKVLFIGNYYKPGTGRFFLVTCEQKNGSPALKDGWGLDYAFPEGPLCAAQELPFMEYEIRAALTMPKQQKVLEELGERCAVHVKR